MAYQTGCLLGASRHNWLVARTYCYVVESGPIGAYKALLLVKTLVQLASVEPHDIFLAASDTHHATLEAIRSTGVHLEKAVCDVILETNTVAVAPGEFLHYEDEQLDEHGFLRAAGDPRLAGPVKTVNDFISKDRQRSFSNQAFWDFRYAKSPQLGSGVGSRGQFLEIKSHLIQREIERMRPNTVLDIGCGDLEVCRNLAVANYVGVDVSAEAIQIARAKRPDWKFLEGDAGSLSLEPADLVLCFDVLIHQSAREAYEPLCAKLVQLTRRALLVAGIDRPEKSTNILFFYEPLSLTLSKFGGSLEAVTSYREVTVFRWTPGIGGDSEE